MPYLDIYVQKNEFLLEKCNTGRGLEALVSESIDTYNNKRPHLDLSFKTPDFMHEKTWVDYSTGFT